MTANTILDPAVLTISQDSNVICLQHQNVTVSGVSIVQCFPESNSGLWISLRDARGSEIGLIPDLAELDGDSRRVIGRLMREKYHVPEITRIVSVDRRPEGARCLVDTEEGEYELLIRGDGDADTRAFPRVVLTDGDSARRYAIPDFTTLDRSSQALARQHLSIARRGGRRYR